MGEAIAGGLGLLIGALGTYMMLRGKVEEMRKACLSAGKNAAVAFFLSGEWEGRVAAALDQNTTDDPQA